MQKEEKKSSYVCFVYTDAENLVRLHKMTGEVQFQTFLFVIIKVLSNPTRHYFAFLWDWAEFILQLTTRLTGFSVSVLS